MSWPLQPLIDLTEKIGSGSTPRGGDSVYVDSGTPLIRSQNIYNSKFTSDGLVFIDEQMADKMKGVTVLENDVLLNITGDSVARCSLADCNFIPARVNQHVAIIRTKKDLLNPDFLMFYLVSPYMQAKMLSSAGTGGTRKALTKGMIEGFEVPAPPIEVQKSIVKVLKAYNLSIENNRRRIQLLEDSARLLYREWFVHLRFPGHEHVKIVDGVPEGWDKVSISQICVDIKDVVKPEDTDGDTPYIGLEHIPRRSITLNVWETAEKVTSNKYRFKSGDIIFGKIRPYFHKIGFALCDGITSSDAIVIRPIAEKYYFLSLMYLSSDYFISLASKTVKEGSKMPRADWGYLLTTKVIMPPEPLLSIFDEQISKITSQLKILSLQNHALVKARDLLLPPLMNGTISV